MRSILFVLIGILTVHCDIDKLGKNRTNYPRLLGNTSSPFRWQDFSVERTIFNGERSGKLCLKNVDKCIEEDLNYERTSNRLSSFLFGIQPPFDLSQVSGVSPLCKKQSEKYIEDLKRFKLWALKMYDSTAKLPSGLLNGNVNQLGDFDMCLQSTEKKEDINGQYCLASMQVEAGNSSPYILALHRLMQSHFHFKSELDDPGHRIPRFSSINWALCIPNSCTPTDVELGLTNTIENITKNTDLRFKILVRPEMCHKSHTRPVPTSTIIALCVFAGIVALVAFAALYDYYTEGTKHRNEWIMAFSLRKNMNTLTTIKRSADDLEAIHGIRFMNAFFLVLAHKSMAVFFAPYVNRTEMVEYLARPWSVIGRAASLYTDPFILVSGILTSYSLIGKLMRHGRINIFEEYVSRLFRILPTFAALIAFCTLVLPWISSGPLWNQVITHHSDICKKYWWRNLLFIHNYYGFNDMCLTHTHHVGIDTQLFFVSPTLVLLLWKWPKKGAYILGFIAVLSTALRFYVTYSMQLSNYVHFGTSIKQLFATADNMYILPIHRATVYILGIFTGYLLRQYRHVTFTKSQFRVACHIFVACNIAAFFSPAFMGSIDYIYNPTHAAWYAAISPIFWCTGFSWFIFTTHIGHSGFWERIFSWPPFSLWTRISYTVYLVQFPVFFYNLGVNRSPQHYGFFRFLLNLQEQAWIVLLAVVLTLLIEMPFQNIRNILFKKKPTSVELLLEKKVT